MSSTELARALVAPGAERLLEDLFSSEGNELFRVELPRPWQGPWARLATALLERRLGTAIAYRPPGGEVTLNPSGDVTAEAVYVILREEQKAGIQALAATLAAA